MTAQLHLGAPALTPGVDRAAWLHDAYEAIGARRQRHRGRLRYAFPLDRGVAVVGTREPYPKRHAA